MNGKGLAPIWFGFLFLGVLVGYPLVLLFVQTLFPDALGGRWDRFLEPVARIFRTEGIMEMLINSLLWAAATTVLSWLAGIPAGWLLGRTNLRWKAMARILLLIPIMTPPYIAALSYVLIMQPGGFLTRLTGEEWPWLQAWFFSFWGVTFVMAAMSFGYVALAVEASLRSIPGRLEEAGAVCGASPATVVRTVTLPLLLPALFNSGLLVFLECLSNFGVPAVLGPRANMPLLPAEIYQLVTSWPVDLALATSLSSLLCLLALAVLWLGQRTLPRSLSGGRSSAARMRSLGAAGQAAAWAFLGLLFFLSAGLPYLAMIGSSLVDTWREGAPTWTLDHYRGLFAAGGRGLQALQTSLILAVSAATISMVCGGVIAYGLSRYPGWQASLLDGLAVLPRVMPKIVVVIGLILAWNAPWIGFNLYGTVGILLVAYVALYVSDALRYADTGLRQIPRRLEQAAESLGATGFRVLLDVIWPLLRPALFAAWMTTFIVCVRELVASVILLPPGHETTATFIFNQFEQGELATAMAMATVTIGVTTGILLAVSWWNRQRAV